MDSRICQTSTASPAEPGELSYLFSVGFAWQILGLAHNAPLTGPAIEGAIGEVTAPAPRSQLARQAR